MRGEKGLLGGGNFGAADPKSYRKKTREKVQKKREKGGVLSLENLDSLK